MVYWGRRPGQTSVILKSALHLDPLAQRRVPGSAKLVREPVHPGKKVLESRRGNTSHQLNPWFAIDYRGEADETHGRVWFGALGWSGNWKFTVEQTSNQQVRVVGPLLRRQGAVEEPGQQGQGQHEIHRLSQHTENSLSVCYGSVKKWLSNVAASPAYLAAGGAPGSV